MSNQLIIPKLNPIKFVRLNLPEVAKYRSRRLDDYRFEDLIRPWNNKIKYFQKWQTSDVVYLQFESNFDPINVDVVDRYGVVRETVNCIKVRANKYWPGYYVYQAAISWAAYAEGCYHLEIVLPDRVLISEPIKVAVNFKNTVLLEYSNSKYHGDIIFETKIRFQLRVEAREGFLNMGSNNTVYEDQKLNPTVLSSQAFEAFPYTYGGTRGIPDWMVRTIFLAYTCNDVMNDGKNFAKPADSKWTYKETERYQMRTMTAELREGINRGSVIVNPGVDPNKRLLVLFNIQSSALFGIEGTDASSTVIRVTSTE